MTALKDRKVDGLVVDTYVAGARKELFSEYFRVRKVFDHKSAYGVVLAGDAMKLQTCFTKYIKENRVMVFETLRRFVKAIEVWMYSRQRRMQGGRASRSYSSRIRCNDALAKDFCSILQIL